MGAGVRPRPELIDEVVQEVYCRLLAAGGRRLRGCRAGSEPELAAFLGRMAERVALDALRTAAAAKRGGGRLVEVLPEEIAERAADPGESPEDRLLDRERRREFLRRCRALARPSRARRDAQIAALALLDGWTSREIAAAAGGRLAPSTVAALVQYMKRQLAAAGLAMAAG
jgi:DNA-directed RNA polymerase specialized sigma24 family protein